jgi:hypothetical protein
MIVIKDVDSTVHKVDAVHDPMQFEHDGDPNLQKKTYVLQHKRSVTMHSISESGRYAVKCALIDVMSGTIYQLSSGDVIVLQTLFKYSNSEVKFHLPYNVRVYE